MMDGVLPLDIKGTANLARIPTRDLVRDFLIDKQVSDELLNEHFLTMIQHLLTGIA